MKLLTYKTTAGPRAGALGRDGKVYDLAAASRHAPGGYVLPEDLVGLLALEDEGLDRARAVLGWAERSGDVDGTPLDQTRLAAPLPRPAN